MADIQLGANWLDQNYPGWIEHIDLGRLDMSSSHDCVVSQASRMDWIDVFDKHFRPTDYTGYALDTEVTHNLGFTAVPDTDGYLSLTCQWRELIEDRRAAAAKPTELIETKPPVTMDDLLHKHAARLEEMYKNETVGDHSFLGALYLFAREIKESGVEL